MDGIKGGGMASQDYCAFCVSDDKSKRCRGSVAYLFYDLRQCILGECGYESSLTRLFSVPTGSSVPDHLAPSGSLFPHFLACRDLMASQLVNHDLVKPHFVWPSVLGS